MNQTLCVKLIEPRGDLLHDIPNRLFWKDWWIIKLLLGILCVCVGGGMETNKTLDMVHCASGRDCTLATQEGIGAGDHDSTHL